MHKPAIKLILGLIAAVICALTLCLFLWPWQMRVNLTRDTPSGLFFDSRPECMSFGFDHRYDGLPGSLSSETKYSYAGFGYLRYEFSDAHGDIDLAGPLPVTCIHAFFVPHWFIACISGGLASILIHSWLKQRKKRGAGFEVTSK